MHKNDLALRSDLVGPSFNFQGCANKEKASVCLVAKAFFRRKASQEKQVIDKKTNSNEHSPLQTALEEVVLQNAKVFVSRKFGTSFNKEYQI